MAKALIVRHGGTDLSCELSRLDRKKLYGYVEQETHDGEGQPCSLVILSSDGKTLVGKGGSTLLMLEEGGRYTTKADLHPQRLTGESVAKVPSSLGVPIDLSVRATVEDLLSHNIKAVYVLTLPMGADGLLATLKEGVIFRFPFSYRGGFDPDEAFLLTSAEGAPFLLLGKPTHHQFISLATEPDTLDEEALEDDEDDSEMDFSMM